MKRPRCILHVGTMKTGTTAIQAWLGSNREWLGENGWHYPGWPCRTAENVSDALEAMVGGSSLVISDEGLWHYNNSHLSDTRKIAKLLDGFDITVLVYVRRPDEFLESWFRQGLKSGTGEHDGAKFLGSPPVSVDAFKRRIDAFQALFGRRNVLFAPYKLSQMKNGSVVADFLSRTSIPSPTNGLPGGDVRENVSPSAETMLVAGLMRKFFGADQPLIDAFMRSKSAPAGRNSNMILTEQERYEILARYRPVFREIQKEDESFPDILDDREDARPAPVSPLRSVYDNLISHGAGFS